MGGDESTGISPGRGNCECIDRLGGLKKDGLSSMMKEKRKQVAFPKVFRLSLKDFGFSRADGHLFSSERDEIEVQPEE